jgi:hypothetical protein
MQAGFRELTEPDQDLLNDLDESWEIICEIPELIRQNGSGFPCCAGDPAKWVAWRANCCEASPRYLLVCDFCKGVYQRWAAMQASVVCAWCKSEVGGFVRFTELNKG